MGMLLSPTYRRWNWSTELTAIHPRNSWPKLTQLRPWLFPSVDIFLGIWGPASAFNPERELYHLAKGIWNLIYGPNHISDYWKKIQKHSISLQESRCEQRKLGWTWGSSKNSVSRRFLLCLKTGHAPRSQCSSVSIQELILMTALQRRWDLKCFSSFTMATVQRWNGIAKLVERLDHGGDYKHSYKIRNWVWGVCL